MNHSDRRTEYVSHVRGIIIAILIAIMILIVFGSFMISQRRDVISNVEQETNNTVEYIASVISNEIGYAESSIKLSAVTISQTMTSDVLENPAEIIQPMVANTPFSAIEYIQADGMNVMNIGESFDASDRVYYQEGIKGNTGIWNNLHPKTSKETLMNFYTPLIYEGNIVGVITGYIGTTSQLASLFETSLYGYDIYGLLVDENNMVICSTVNSEFIPDQSIDMLMDQYNANDLQKQNMKNILDEASDIASLYKSSVGEGRIAVATIPETEWKVVIVVPGESFKGLVSENTRKSVTTLLIISIIVLAYASYVLYRNAKRRKAIAAEKAKLQTENLEIRDIIASANMGTWKIELVDGEEPRMNVDAEMKFLLGLEEQECTPEEVYIKWFSNIAQEAVPSVLNSVEQMKNGNFDENTYLWIHPTKGERYVRCGGTAQVIPGGYILRGYHYDVDDTVREDQAKVAALLEALSDKNEYYSALSTLESIFYSMHIINLDKDTVKEFSSKNDVKRIVNHEQGAIEMMINVINATMSEDYLADALAFTDLTTLADRMQNKKMITRQLFGKNVGWILASFITMTQDKEEKPTQVIFTTRIIDDEKKQEEKLIEESQTDELTGFFNRRAYEEDIYLHNDTPEEDNFVYVSMDVNGLKVVNDSKGHAAGDELLTGAAQCMKKSLGAYGRLYRTGGDEFAAIIFSSEDRLKDIFADFDDVVGNWSGELVDSLSISHGYATKSENRNMSVKQLAEIADQKMYEAKAEHYRKAGFDRRGQRDAHKALCDLYTKILKINITDDTYQIVNMDMAEQTVDKGFADSISAWLTAFGESGQVHPDDLDEYLKYTDLNYMRDYFAGNKTSLHIFYRRKYGSEFKKVLMEIIPANDYSSDNQSLFLYVKNIDI